MTRGQVHAPAPSSVIVAAGRGGLRLWLYGGAMLALVIYFAWRYPLRTNVDKLVDLGQLSRYGRGAYAGFVVGAGIWFVLYVLALVESRRVPADRAFWPVFGCGALLAAGMATMYPVTAIDLFLYAGRSRLFTTYGANPLVDLLRDYPADAWAPLMHPQWINKGSSYGPLWTLIAAPITWLADDRLGLALAGFKLLALLCHLGAGWIIVRILTITRVAHPVAGGLFYLWNPLVLWEGVGNGHNDVVVLVPLLLAVLAWVARRDILVIPLLIAAVLIKYVPALILPLATIALWSRSPSWRVRWRRACWSLLLSLLVVGIALYPFYDLRAVYRSVAVQNAIFRNSPAAVAGTLLQARYSWSLVLSWATGIGKGLVLGMLVWQGLAVWRRPDQLPRASFEVLYLFLLAASWNFNAWYLIWPVGLAALLPWSWPSWRMIAWTAAALGSYGFFIWVAAWWRLAFAPSQTIGVALMVAPTALLTLAELVSAATTRAWRTRARPQLQA